MAASMLFGGGDVNAAPATAALSIPAPINPAKCHKIETNLLFQRKVKAYTNLLFRRIRKLQSPPPVELFSGKITQECAKMKRTSVCRFMSRPSSRYKSHFACLLHLFNISSDDHIVTLQQLEPRVHTHQSLQTVFHTMLWVIDQFLSHPFLTENVSRLYLSTKFQMKQNSDLRQDSLDSYAVFLYIFILSNR